MNTILTTVGTALVGALLAVGTAFAVTNAASSTPEPVDEPVVVYGER